MLGWAIKKGIHSVTGATDAHQNGADDTTQLEAPDTPAPVFAARAIQHAIFGTPAATREANQRRAEGNAGAVTEEVMGDLASPTRPAGILLTPGTGTARRKRVSFGHDVKAGNNGASNGISDSKQTKSTLQQALEDSRPSKASKQAASTKSASVQVMTDATAPKSSDGPESDDEWEDDEVCQHDVTVDLNDPHSRSGKYWKSEFAKYADEARQEMERLVKYKHLSKLYAEKKDAEALDLNQKLKEEHEKVAKMERQITDMAAFVGDKRNRSDSDSASLMTKLSEQSALAVQYRQEVKELEAMLRKQQKRDENKPSRRIDTSPGTEKTLLEVRRELRWANAELRKMEKLQKEVERLKSELSTTKERSAMLEQENKAFSKSSSSSAETSRLEKELRRLKDESRTKDEEIAKLNSLKGGAKLQISQARQVLQEKNDRIEALEQEVKTLRGSAAAKHRSANMPVSAHQRTTSELRESIESLSRPSRHETTAIKRPVRRSVSSEDLTLDFGQNDKAGSRPWDTNLGGSEEIAEQLKRNKTKQIAAWQSAQQVERESVAVKPSALTSARSSTSSAGVRRVLGDRVNSSSPYDLLAFDNSKPTSRAASSTFEKHIKPSSFEAPTSCRNPFTVRDEPTFDLVQDRFAQLGAPDGNGTLLTANASRCTLPADRQAAARARLERKRKERRVVEAKEFDKENVGSY